mgnify:CR=1 FL=1
MKTYISILGATLMFLCRAALAFLAYRLFMEPAFLRFDMPNLDFVFWIAAIFLFDRFRGYQFSSVYSIIYTKLVYNEIAAQQAEEKPKPAEETPE